MSAAYIAKAVVLAAGRGRRLRPLTRDVPKPMLPVNGRPLLDYALGLLRLYGVQDVAINLHHQAHVIHGYVGDGSRFGLQVTYSHERRLLGSAGALRPLARFLDSTFFIVYGDVLTNLDLSRLAEYHRAKGGPLTTALYREADSLRCGVAEVDAVGRIRRFEEKPAMPSPAPAWVAAGVLVCEPWVLRLMPRKLPCDLGADLLPALVEQGVPVYGYRSAGYFLDIGSRERYLKAQRDAVCGLVRPAAVDAGPLRWTWSVARGLLAGGVHAAG